MKFKTAIKWLNRGKAVRHCRGWMIVAKEYIRGTNPIVTKNGDPYQFSTHDFETDWEVIKLYCTKCKKRERDASRFFCDLCFPP